MKKAMVYCCLSLVMNSVLAESKPVAGITIFKEQLDKAKSGVVYAQKNVGAYYYFGYDGVEQNYKKSFEWFELAAKAGDRKSQEMIAYMYSQGIYVEKSDERALSWIKESKATEKREKDYLLNCKPYRSEIGCLAQWEGLPSLQKQKSNFEENLKKANTKKVTKSVALAQYNVFKSYMYGEGVGVSHSDAISWIMKSAYNKNAKAAYNLAVLFYLTKGVGPDFLEFMEIAEELKEEDAVLIMKLIRLDEKNYHLENYAPITQMIKPFIEMKY